MGRTGGVKNRSGQWEGPGGGKLTSTALFGSHPKAFISPTDKNNIVT
jgi:hypothetical protein